ncbi:MAG: DUF305 domain-containing protein [Mycobacteriaceae bacterium]
MGVEVRAHRPTLLVLAGVAVLAVGFLIGALVQPAGQGASHRVPEASSVDVGFAQDMTVHHRQAVQMANTEIGSSDPVVSSLAFDIASTQQVQIGQMQGWLSLWGHPLLPSAGYMGWMAADARTTGDHGGHTPDRSAATITTMPGMATSAELTRLRQATGPARDVLFLQLMLRHHEGGTSMLDHAAQHAREPAVQAFATQLAGSQRAEVLTMTGLLAQRGAQPLPVGG